MAEIYKVIAQSDPLAATLTDVYTVPASTEAVVSSFTVANRTGIKKTFRVSVAVAGVADSLEQYLIYDLDISKNDVNTFTLGMTLAATDVIRVRTDVVGLSFNFFGTEIS